MRLNYSTILIMGFLGIIGLQQAYAQIQLEENVVTANKRSQLLTDVGKPIADVSSEELQGQRIVSLEGLARVEPSLNNSVTDYSAAINRLRGAEFADDNKSAYPVLCEQNGAKMETRKKMESQKMLNKKKTQKVLVDHWVDIHGHFFPPMPEKERQEIVEGLRQNCWCIDHLDQWTPEATLDYMDRIGMQMQMLSYVPSDSKSLRRANEYGAQLVREYPDRFGLLAALPTDDPQASLLEIAHAADELQADGFAVQNLYNGVSLSDPSLEPVLAELNRRKAVVFAHPNAYGSAWNRPAALMEVAFQTAHVIADMLYQGVFRRHPDIQFVFTHSGGAFPAISGRLLILGTEPWVPNPNQITRDEMREVFGRLFLDTAASMPTGLGAALTMTSPEKIVYGSDCGVPCSSEASLIHNIEELLAFKGLTKEQIQAIGRNALNLFPNAKARIDAASKN